MKSGIPGGHTFFYKSQLLLRKLHIVLCFQGVQVQAAGQTQLQKDVILRAAAPILHRLAVRVQKAMGVAEPVKALAVHAAVGRRAKTQVILAVPVQQVVPSLKTGAGKVADLVLGKAGLFQLLYTVEIKICGSVLVRQTGRGTLAEGGARLNF